MSVQSLKYAISSSTRLAGLSRQTCYSGLERPENGEKDHEASLDEVGDLDVARL
jgi:hypothetical protein